LLTSNVCAVIPRFRHEEPQNRQRHGGDRREKQEAGAIAEVMHDGAGDELAERSPDAGRGSGLLPQTDAHLPRNDAMMAIVGACRSGRRRGSER
jgi:hypothetical protein